MQQQLVHAMHAFPFNNISMAATISPASRFGNSLIATHPVYPVYQLQAPLSFESHQLVRLLIDIEDVRYVLHPLLLLQFSLDAIQISLSRGHSKFSNFLSMPFKFLSPVAIPNFQRRFCILMSVPSCSTLL
jgi:hypothetical protein